jgi:PGF-CTERM protein
MRRFPTLLIAAIALLSLGVGGVVAAGSTGATVGDAPASATAAECDVGDGPELVGCWNGTHYEDDLSFNQSDGLSESELEALTHLTMARVEYIRERPFREDVPVQTVTRSEFMNDSTGGNGTPDEAFRTWNDQVWEALFVVGETKNANDEIDTVFGGAVSGFYSPSEDRIVLVVAEGAETRIDPSTLAHELAHAMQDQYHDLTQPRYVGTTQDGDLAIDGIVEGEAVHIEELYTARCASNWSCIEAPTAGGGGGSSADFNFGILQTVLQPYSDGALYVESLVEEEGWAAVNETMNEPPASTAEVIHRTPEYETTEIEFEDTATGDWETYPDQGVDGAETAGEASMFVMFWYQSFEYGYPVLEPDASVRENVRIHTRPDRELQTRANYNYAHESTDGWAGDELYPYRAGDGDDARDGYVWVTEWQTAGDAADFRETYLTMITAHGDDAYEAGEVYEIEDGDFPGAYGVVRDGSTVTIVHATEPAGVLELRPGTGLALPATDDTDGADGGDDTDTGSDSDDSTGTGTGTDTDDGTDTDVGGDDADDSSGPDASTDDATPGFGIVATLLGLVAAVSLLARRSRD